MLTLWERWLRMRLTASGRAPAGQIYWLLANVPAHSALLTLEERLRTTCREVTLIGWRCPERNLDFPAWLLFRLCLACSREPLRGRCMSFLLEGGIEGVVARIGRQASAREPLLGGAATQIRLAEKAGPGYVVRVSADQSGS